MAARSAAAIRFLRAACGAARAFSVQAVAEAKSGLGRKPRENPWEHVANHRKMYRKAMGNTQLKGGKWMNTGGSLQETKTRGNGI